MHTRLYKGTARNLAFLAARLRAGELVAAPTETVYGLAANAFDARACRRIFRAKGRPAADPLIVHIHSLAQLHEICQPNATALRLAQCFWPGPLTLVLPKRAVIPDVVTAGRDSVAVRMPSHPLFRRLLRATGVPLAAPSANPFGYVSPTTAAHVHDGLSGKIGYILDGGPTSIGVESTIVDVRDPARPRLLRPGYVTAEDISRCLSRQGPRGGRRRAEDGGRRTEDGGRRTEGGGRRTEDGGRKAEDGRRKAEDGRRTADGRGRAKTSMLSRPSSVVRRPSSVVRSPTSGLLAPGMLARHYSPRTPVELHASLAGRVPAAGEAFLLVRKPKGLKGRKGGMAPNIFWLDAKGDLRAVARRLFAMLRLLDAKGYRVIHAELAPGRGLAEAINDRLHRAASR